LERLIIGVQSLHQLFNALLRYYCLAELDGAIGRASRLRYRAVSSPTTTFPINQSLDSIEAKL
jgi:hypothetical protein